MEFTRQEQFDAYVDLILSVRQEGTIKDGEAAAERRKTALAPINKKKSARKAAALEWARKNLEAQRTKDRSYKPKKMTKEDVAAAAVYRAQAEEARRNHERREEFDAVIKWIGTGDPEAIRISNQWVEENMEAMKLEAPDATEDWEGVEAKRNREFSEFLWVDSFGSSPIQPPMCYTDDKPPRGTAYPMRTLQVFSVRVAAIKGGLDWPLDVYGIVAARDSFDHNPNIIFSRTRDNCQTIDKKNPCLRLTGPTRAIVVVDPVYFEVNLQVKGRTESEDRGLSYLVLYYRDSGSSESYVIKRVISSKLSTVALVFGDIVNSLEATISVRVVGGEWPEGFQGLIFANTASIDAKKIELLAFGDKLPLTADCMIQLSRHVVSVEANGELRVSVMASSLEDQTVERDSETFRAKKASRSMRMLEVHCCKFEVTVTWSLVPNLPHFHKLAKDV